MSIAILSQVYDEMRRLAIAGSVTAGGDFRLKKLIPSLEQAGAKAPVFVKIAQAVKALVEGTEKTSAPALLELCTLVSAVLYTQGETGRAGAWTEIETIDLGSQTAQESARVLKPLLEALTTTGSGRLEIIKDAIEWGAFRDMRLVKPALDAIDDSNPVIGHLIATEVLPLYGKAILPDLKSQFDLKSRKSGQFRQLALMHQLDPKGTRELVQQALESGSKEMRIVALNCLGDSSEDLPFLLELSLAKDQYVRWQALRAIGKALRKVMMSSDIDIALRAIQQNPSAELVKLVIDEAGRQLKALFKTKNTSKAKNEIGKGADRFLGLLSCLEERKDKATEAFLVKVFQRRQEILALEGEPGGSDINDRVAKLIGGGSKKVQKMLASAHATLSPELLGIAFEAARQSMKPAQVFVAFSPYLRATVDEKKKARDPAWARRAAIVEAITAHVLPCRNLDERNKVYEDGTWDPRWLDVAVEIGDEELTSRLARSTHEGCKKLLSKLWRQWHEAAARSPAIPVRPDVILGTMIRIEHPDAISSVIAAIKKHNSNKRGFDDFDLISGLIPDLPKSALAPLEALLPTLRDKTADQLAGYVTELKNKS